MFAIASIFILLGLWAVIACILDWDSCLGVIDIRATGEAFGSEDLARWVIGGGGGVVVLMGLLCLL